MLTAFLPASSVIIGTASSFIAIPEPTVMLAVIIFASLLLILGLAAFHLKRTLYVKAGGVEFGLGGT